MKYLVLVLGLAAISLSAQTSTQKKERPKIKLASKTDPVCNMDMPQHLKDTVHFQDNIYGVCSSHCKVELKKNPKKYLRQAYSTK